MQKILAVVAVVAGGLSFLSVSGAQAQSANAVSASSTQALSTSATPEAPQALTDDTGGAIDPTPMAFAGVGVKVGMAGMGAGTLRIKSDGLPLKAVDSRRGVHLALPINLGGDGFGWLIEPYMSRSSVARVSSQVARDGSTSFAAGEPTDLTAYGMFTGPVYNVHVTTPLYLGVGVGLKAAYLATSGFDIAADAYARIPLSATYYLSNQVAVVAELGLGYGASVFLTKDAETKVDPVTKEVSTDDSPMFGTAFAWDCSVGVRLP